MKDAVNFKARCRKAAERYRSPMELIFNVANKVRNKPLLASHHHQAAIELAKALVSTQDPKVLYHLVRDEMVAYYMDLIPVLLGNNAFQDDFIIPLYETLRNARRNGMVNFAMYRLHLRELGAKIDRVRDPEILDYFLRIKECRSFILDNSLVSKETKLQIYHEAKQEYLDKKLRPKTFANLIVRPIHPLIGKELVELMHDRRIATSMMSRWTFNMDLEALELAWKLHSDHILENIVFVPNTPSHILDQAIQLASGREIRHQEEFVRHSNITSAALRVIWSRKHDKRIAEECLESKKCDRDLAVDMLIKHWSSPDAVIPWQIHHHFKKKDLARVVENVRALKGLASNGTHRV